MDEAIDQKGPVLHPAPPDQVPRATRAHRELGDQHGTAVLTVPFAVGTRVVGALTLERPSVRPFDRAVVELVEAVAGLTGPMLEALRRDDRWLVTKAFDASRRQLAHLIGPRHIASKLGAVAAVAIVALLVLATGEYRVAARAVMEAQVQRVAVAPFNGYVRDAPVRRGRSGAQRPTARRAGRPRTAPGAGEMVRAAGSAREAATAGARRPERRPARRRPPPRSIRRAPSWPWSMNSSPRVASSRASMASW